MLLCELTSFIMSVPLRGLRTSISPIAPMTTYMGDQLSGGYILHISVSGAMWLR